MQWPTDRSSELHKLVRMPVASFSPSGSRGEFEGDVGHLRAGDDIFAPASPIAVRPGVEMQRGGLPFAQKLSMYERDPFHAVQVIPTRLITEHAEVRRRNESDA